MSIADSHARADQRGAHDIREPRHGLRYDLFCGCSGEATLLTGCEHSWYPVFGSRLFTNCSLSGRAEVRPDPVQRSASSLPRLCGSYGQTEFSGGLLLRAVERDESIDPLASVKPERRS